MEIDGGPPPFCGATTTVDDSFDKNPHYDDVDEEESPETSSNLPLPRDSSRSRSVTPVSSLNTLDMTQEVTSSELLEKGDTNVSSTKEEEGEKVEEDDDDWGDFEESTVAPAPIQNNPPPPVPPLQMNDDDDDDWGAFDQARPSTDRSEEQSDQNSSARSQEQQLAHQQSLEEWGAFETTADNQKEVDDDDEWQAEFSSAPPPAPTITLENLKALEEMLEDDTFWDDGFAEDDCQNESTSMDVVDIPSLFDAESLEEMSNGFDDDEKQRYSKLWLALRVIEEAISLKFDWNKSEVRKNHFKSLKINPITVKKEIRATAAAFDTSNLLLPTPIQQHPSTSDSHHDSSNPKTSSSSPSVDSPSVPAVDFDWDTSGLTNPMNRANQSSAIIDVDFLGSNGVATAYTSTLQKDLEQFGLNGSVKTTSNGSTILETLMSRANGANNHFRAPEVLSLDARKLLEKLPDLQYLQSEVLMFPVGTNLPH